MVAHTPQLVSFVEQTNESGGTYHRIDLGEGLVLEGQYDISKCLDRYYLPEDLQGQTALDVGTATGFFALELARRGAQVTAIDIWPDHHMPLLCESLGLEVSYIQKNLYDLDPSFGRFDLVFCGSVLLHLWDHFTALQRLRSVCRGKAIIATPVMPQRRFRREKRPLVELIADRVPSTHGEYWVTWRPSVQALSTLLSAVGFEDVEYKGDFQLERRLGDESEMIQHGVFHAAVKAP